MCIKICTLCKKEKKIEEFNWRIKNKKRQPRCKECTRNINNKHYSDNKSVYLNNVLENKERIKKWYINYKSTLFCTECGENRSPCLDFHHTDGSEKELAVSRAVHNAWSIERIKKEINKCIIVCKNCHAIIHANEHTSVAQ